MSEKFSVVIPSYNGKEFLRKTLLALRKSNVQPLRYIVVDDYSSDETSEMLKKEFPEIKLIRNEKNLGPTASRNRGAKKAEGEYIVFTDNDILVRDDSLKKLFSFLTKTRDAGMVGGKLINEEGKSVFYNMGNIFRGFISIYDKSIPVGWIIESFIAVRRDLFEKLGGFDEDYFMFGEGPDLSERMRKEGYKTYFVHDAIVNMREGHTHQKWKRRAWLWVASWKFFVKHRLESR
ncbi:hypothetical protein A3I27_01665 [Candidatus Giovannonibacteria bacterium RIFCSPLOWO2_02_FULL_43_11b]|uniref:Glycosyltransferase 2-like domain-containing protein n=1 Tax=Candidatus Giovannonibacteria bacterium RIFCSPHIGHO2_12_FULL_43_15 TaxID=1798341 RepID=A0A1F5WP24_9BACT|nr:MAG: hypothetical protein A2739_01140 [Candidatus Giovannonibacteria bacterium RIFCSPHIGHO2_01_FULL_43_100]OGF66463.1 MAG: hypothetical protein A3B97_03940 [Candidatus Giovannonibacteria bacterium RIFCSPHIGHO2_02_FULL_43_32]OGF77408.1 MAG: hypothetical protein A3F23_03725 [Candidatus Giovannonibacteria bacterium RIFCSPHIGHO2_12_FULL_43_15]OGF78434.1 MAG: hypothetical protein A3A15_03515 [Candidatus Giovannonibacteria bacterium RIFCSPLOWO2_01_FULL_43_60]OGF89793.1 MAG: hypothetical protein A3